MRAERVWPLAIIGALGVTVAANVILVRLAAEPNGAVVEPHYYRKAVMWDSSAAVARASAALGWVVEVETGALEENGAAPVRVIVRDRDGCPVTGAQARIEAVSNLDAARRVVAPLVPDADGAYFARLPLARGGLWEYRVRATRGRDVSVHALRQDVAGPRG